MALQVKVLLSASFRETAGKKELLEELDSGSTVRDLLEKLAKKFGKDFNDVLDPKTKEIDLDTLVLLNGESVRKTDVKLKDGDVLLITVPIAGG